LAYKDKACQSLASPVASEADRIRTRNHWIDSPPPVSPAQELAPDGAQHGAELPDDSRLGEVNSAWPALPEHIRAAIIPLVHSAEPAEK